MPYLLTPQHVSNVPFSYCGIVSMLCNRECRSKTVSTVTQQHPQGPRSVLSFSFAILRLLLAFVLKLILSGSSVAAATTRHLLIQLLHEAEGMRFLI